jgi:CRP-like cAMP-binding protein
MTEAWSPTEGQTTTAAVLPRVMAPFLRHLQSLTLLADDEIDLVNSLSRRLREYPAKSELHREGQSPPPRVLVSGWACRTRMLSDGRRQIVSFLLPGDLVSSVLHPSLPEPCSAVALTRVETVDASALKEAFLAGDHLPGLSRGVRAMMLQAEMLLCDQIVRLGRQTAYERTAHLLLEFRDRLATVGLANESLANGGGRAGAGLASGDSFPMPLTQEMLADCLGLSIVHVNRTVQHMRREGSIEMRTGVVIVREPELLRAVADWHPLPRPQL